MKNKKNSLIIISGPSGVGKDSVITKIRHLEPSISLSVSATTRAPREGEVDGVNYHFISKDDFKSKIENSEFLEYNEYCGNYYGTLRRPVDKAVQSGRKIILKIDVHGAIKVRDLYPGCLSVFIVPPDMESLKERILLRNSDDRENVNLRLKRAEFEIAEAESYDIVVENDTVDTCSRKILDKIYDMDGGFYGTSD